MPRLTLSRAAAALHGVSPADLECSELSPTAAHALKPLLQSHGFDVTRPIHVLALPDFQGFRVDYAPGGSGHSADAVPTDARRSMIASTDLRAKIVMPAPRADSRVGPSG